MFRWWLHSEAGYKFIGEESFYRLTLQELRVLLGGFQLEQREKKDRAKGVEPGDRAKLQEFDQKLENNRDALRTR